MNMRIIFAAVILSSMMYCANAVERRTYPCHRLVQAPTIDGKMDDEAWQNIPEATGFYIYKIGGSNKYAVEKQTYFKAGWTDDAIYLLVRAEERAPEKMIAKAKDGGTVWGDDSIELFLLPLGAAAYTQLIVNSAGSRYGRRGNENINISDWEAKTIVGKTEWLLELRVPFTVLAGKAKATREGDEWPANVARNIFPELVDEHYTCWPLLKEGFHDVNNFGRFVFKGPLGGKVMAEENDINRVYIQYVLEAINKLACRAEEYEKELAAIKKQDCGNAEAENLLSIWKQIVKFAAQPTPDYRELMPVSRAYVNLQQRSDDCIARGMMEVLLKE